MNLLLAIDDTPASDAAVRAVASEPWARGAHVRVLSVISQDPAAALPGVSVPTAPLAEVPPWPVGTLETRRQLQFAREHMLRGHVDALAALGLTVEARVRWGQPGPEILDEARDWHADLIVVGSRARSAIKRLLLGSVATHLTRHAPCSVQVVRDRRAQHDDRSQ